MTPHRLNMPAGSPIRLTATARPQAGLHRWEVQVLAAADAAPRLAFGSLIGGADREQRIEIPAQDVDCRLEVSARHATSTGWGHDRSNVAEETPTELQVGFFNPDSFTARNDDVLLSFTLGAPDQPN